MKRSVAAAICGLGILGGAQAGGSASVGDEAQKASPASPAACEMISKYAEVVMLGRQYGGSAPEAMGRIDSLELGDENPLVSTLRAMVVEAYKSPLISSDEGKESLAMEFSNFWYVSCIE